MSSVQKSGKTTSAREFALEDIDNLLSSRAKKETAVVPKRPESRQAVTRSKSSGSKGKKPIEPTPDFNGIRSVLLTSVDEIMQTLESFKEYPENMVKKLQEELCDVRKVAAAKDGYITELLRKHEEVLRAAESRNQENLDAEMSRAKIMAAKAILQVGIKIAEEAKDPGFDRASWDVEGWRTSLKDLEGDGESAVEAAGGASYGVTSMHEVETLGVAADAVATMGDEDAVKV